MAAPTFHLTDAQSGFYNPTAFEFAGPGTLSMDAGAWLIALHRTLILSGALTATINGKVTSYNFLGGSTGGAGASAGIYVSAGHPTITIGATGEVGGPWGILTGEAASADITNKGRIHAQSAIDGRGIAETDGTYTIKNSGIIESAFIGLQLGPEQDAGGTTHTIINSGSIVAPTAIDAAYGTTKLTNSGLIDGDIGIQGKAVLINSGVIHGDVGLGASNSNNTFTDFVKVTVNGKTKVQSGVVTGGIFFGNGNDHFNGGSNAETVHDSRGQDVYKLGGGNDTYIPGTFRTSDGTDTADGGAGRDTIDLSSSIETAFIVNLDTKPHGGANANTAFFISFIGSHPVIDKVFNFEDVIGSTQDDIIYGNASANHLVGGGGTDQLYGFGGNDVLVALGGSSQLFGGNGNDVLKGGPGCYLEGGAGNDTLSGSLGSSDLYGGAGADILTPGDFQGTGIRKHFFRYKALSDSGVTIATRDTITNFTPGVNGDFIDLSAIDANPATKTISEDFTFIGQSQWGGHAGELRYVWTADQTFVEADVNGDKKADFSIALDGHLTLAATDFIGASGSPGGPPLGIAASLTTPPYHITDAQSGLYTPPGAPSGNAFAFDAPGTLLMDADAWIVSSATILLIRAALTATINGKVTSSNFSGAGNAGIAVSNNVSTSLGGHSSIAVGATGEVTGYTWGVISDPGNPTDIVNQGHIAAVGPSGRGIAEADGTYTIKNSGIIESAFIGLDLSGGGTHTIVNSGSIIAPVAVVDTGITKMTNTGTISGDVRLSGDTAALTNGGVIDGNVQFDVRGDIFTDGNDSFTNFAKINGKVDDGVVTGTIDLGNGNDTFKGGNNAETVQDSGGSDVYKLGGGNDSYIVATGGLGSSTNAVDGGAGRDSYDFSATDADFTVNLDTKPHDGFAANTALHPVTHGTVTDKVLNFEDVIGGGGDDVIYGSASANHLVGGSGADQLYGLGGNDVLDGGNDNDYLDGGAGNDVLNGGNGAIDHLYGGAGRDIMTGGNNITGPGTGGDVNDAINYFHFTSLSDSGVTAATRDVITDFIPSSTFATGRDFIDLSAIDAVPKTKGVNDDFHFIGESKWHDQPGELRYVRTASQTIVEADVNGDGKADFSIALTSYHTLTVDDFIGAF